MTSPAKLLDPILSYPPARTTSTVHHRRRRSPQFCLLPAVGKRKNPAASLVAKESGPCGGRVARGGRVLCSAFCSSPLARENHGPKRPLDCRYRSSRKCPAFDIGSRFPLAFSGVHPANPGLKGCPEIPCLAGGRPCF